MNIRFGQRGFFGDEMTYDMQFERDEAILFSNEEPLQLSAAWNFSNGFDDLQWRYDIMTLGALIEVQRAGSQNFAVVNQTVSMSTWNATWSDLDLRQGANTVRVTMLGGPYLKNNQIHISTNSAPATHTVTVNQARTQTIDAPTNLLTDGGWSNGHSTLRWRHSNRSMYQRIEISRGGSRRYEFVANAFSNSMLLSELGLRRGSNTVRITSIGGLVTFESGILTNWTNSAPATFEIQVDEVRTEVLSAPTDLTLSDGVLTWQHGGSWHSGARVYLQKAGGTRGFNFVRQTYYGVDVNWLDLGVGDNVVRIVLAGGGARLHNRVLTNFTNSPPSEITITITEMIDRAMPAPTDFGVSDEWLSPWWSSSLYWSIGQNVWDVGSYRVFIQREGAEEFEYLGYSSWSAMTPFVDFNRLNLVEGENVVKIITSTHLNPTVEGTIFVRFVDSEPAFVTLIMDIEGKISIKTA
jgi:hypothetical protein